MQPITNVMGKQVALGPMCRNLLPVYQRWFNDFAALRNLDDAPRPRTLEGRSVWYEQQTTDEHGTWFTIYRRDDWQPVGTTAWGNINFHNRTAEYFIYIGEHGNRGKGYGTETTRLMLEYAFTALGLHNVMLTVAGWNVAGQRAYAKAGFQEFGRRRACSQMAGQQYDTVYMECLGTDFESPVV